MNTTYYFLIKDNIIFVFREIEVLDISGCWRINDVGLQRIGEYCPKIRDLKVDECRKITEFSLKRFRYEFCSEEEPIFKFSQIFLFFLLGGIPYTAH